MGNEALGLSEILLPHFTDEEAKSTEKASSLPEVTSRAEKAAWLVPHTTLTCLGTSQVFLPQHLPPTPHGLHLGAFCSPAVMLQVSLRTAGRGAGLLGVDTQELRL